MKIGVTGAAGHLGSTICRTLIDKGYEVVALVHNNQDALKDLPITVVKGNVLDHDSLKSFMAECDAIIHSAAAINLSYKFDQNTFDINVTGTKNILEIAKELKISKVVQVSSIHAFTQQPCNKSLNEKRNFVTDKSAFYDQTKRDAHLLSQEAAKNGQHVVIVCPTAILGPHDYKPSKLGQAIIDIYSDKFPALFRGGFDFVDVRDVAEGIVSALEKGVSGESYILSGKYYTIKKLSNFVFDIKGTKKRLVALPFIIAYAGLPFIKVYSIITRKPQLYDKLYIDLLKGGNKLTSSRKAQKELDYKPRTLKVTLIDTINWMKNQEKI